MRSSATVAFALTAAMAAFTGCSAAGERAPHAVRGFVADQAQEAGGAEGAAAAAPTKLPFDLGQGGWDDRTSSAPGASTAGRSRDAATKGGVAPASDPARTERMLVYSGQIRVEVSKPADVMAEFRAQVTAWGGHLQRQNDYTLVVRVPASKFEEAFQWVRAAGRVLAESRQTGDVTEEFIDLGIRLDNARKSRDRLLEVLQRAEKVEDILKVEAELRRLTEEIERMEGRRKFLTDQVALSTLEATFQPLTELPVSKRVRRPSRFAWINAIGAEPMMGGF